MNEKEPTPQAIAFAGLFALAVAMGVGRFAFTPIFPMMQEDSNVSIAAGGRLAAANYLGFLLGAASAVVFRLPQTVAIRYALLAVGILTLGMGFTARYAAWLLLRFLAGVANAWAQVFTFAWCLEKLAAAGRPLLNGVVVAGAGVGIVLTGGLCLALMRAGASSADAWIVLGLFSLAGTAFIWRVFTPSQASAAAGALPRGFKLDGEALKLVLCFGGSGVGYIVPATFLPVMARQFVSDPGVFGLAWPIFGAAAAFAPLPAAAASRILGNRRLWAASHLIMAFGVALPIWRPGLGGIMVAALLVGWTFMVNATAGMQEAQAVGGSRAAGLMAAMIAAFGTGQIVGPLMVSLTADARADFSTPLLAAAAVLVASAGALMRRRSAYR